MKTIKQIIELVCYELNEPAPATIVGNTDPQVRQYLALLQSEGDDLRARYDLPALKRKYRLETAVGQKLYPLPADYWRLLLDTAWDESNQWAMFGPEDDRGIVERDLGIVPYGTQYSFRIIGAPYQTVAETSFTESGGYIEVSPEPQEVRELYLEYIGVNWIYPVQWAASTAYTAGALVSANGNIYRAGNSATSNTIRPSGESTSAGDTVVAWQLWRNAYDTLLADTDYPIIDWMLLKHGLLARVKAAKGLDASMDIARYETALMNSVGRYQGSASVMGDGPRFEEFPIIAEDFVSGGW